MKWNSIATSGSQRYEKINSAPKVTSHFRFVNCEFINFWNKHILDVSWFVLLSKFEIQQSIQRQVVGRSVFLGRPWCAAHLSIFTTFGVQISEVKMFQTQSLLRLTTESAKQVEQNWIYASSQLVVWAAGVDLLSANLKDWQLALVKNWPDLGQPQVAYDKKKRSMVAPDVLDEVGQVFEELCPSLWGRSHKWRNYWCW